MVIRSILCLFIQQITMEPIRGHLAMCVYLFTFQLCTHSAFRDNFAFAPILLFARICMFSHIHVGIFENCLKYGYDNDTKTMSIIKHNSMIGIWLALGLLFSFSSDGSPELRGQRHFQRNRSYAQYYRHADCWNSIRPDGPAIRIIIFSGHNPSCQTQGKSILMWVR